MSIGWLVVGCLVLLPFVIAAIVALVVSETARWVAVHTLGLVAACLVVTAGIMAVLYGAGVEFE